MIAFWISEISQTAQKLEDLNISSPAFAAGVHFEILLQAGPIFNIDLIDPLIGP